MNKNQEAISFTIDSFPLQHSSSFLKISAIFCNYLKIIETFFPSIFSVLFSLSPQINLLGFHIKMSKVKWEGPEGLKLMCFHPSHPLLPLPLSLSLSLFLFFFLFLFHLSVCLGERRCYCVAKGQP